MKTMTEEKPEKRNTTVNMTRGNVWKVLFLYSMPLLGSALVQQLYSLVDLVVVGNFAKEGDRKSVV